MTELGVRVLLTAVADGVARAAPRVIGLTDVDKVEAEILDSIRIELLVLEQRARDERLGKAVQDAIDELRRATQDGLGGLGWRD